MSECDSDNREVVQASDISAKIERGEPVEFSNVIIKGDIDLSKLDLQTEHVKRDRFAFKYYFILPEEMKIVESPIKITNSEILGNIRFSDVIFREQVMFKTTNFAGNAWFSRSNFSRDVIFERTVFSGGPAYFEAAVFSGGAADFSFTNFSGDLPSSFVQISRADLLISPKPNSHGGLHTPQGTYPAALASAELENQIAFSGRIFSAHLHEG